MKNGFTLALAVFCMVPASAVQAQGVFDLGALTNTIAGTSGATSGQPAGGLASALSAPPAAVSAADRQKLIYTPSLELRQAGYKKFVETLRPQFPTQADAYQQIFGQMDIIAEMGKGMETQYGLRLDNMGDAMAAWFVTMWMTSRGRSDDNTREEIASVQKQTEAILAKIPEISKLDNAQKQEFAESLWMNVVSMSIEMEAAKSDPQKLKELQAAAHKTVRDTFKFELGNFELTPNGFVQKKKN